MTALVPYTRGELVRLAHERAQILSERHTGEGTQLVLRVDGQLAGRFSEFQVDGSEEFGDAEFSRENHESDGEGGSTSA